MKPQPPPYSSRVRRIVVVRKRRPIFRQWSHRFRQRGRWWFIGDGSWPSPGFSGVTVTSNQTYTTVPEPAAALLGSFGLLAILRRRK